MMGQACEELGNHESALEDRSWKLVESGPRLEKGGAVVGDEEGVGTRVGPESELQHIEL